MTDRTPTELIRALSLFAEPPGEEHARIAELLDLGRAPSRAEYAELFLFQLYPYASVYLGPEGWLGGEARERIAGFWRAVGRTPPAEPDHLTALLGLYGSLADENAGGGEASARLLAEARRALLHEHVAPWLFAYLEEVGELASDCYSRWAAVLHETLRAEVGRAGMPDGVTAHFAGTEPVPDPRAEGGAQDLLDSLLAPARSGAIITRARLGGLAHRRGLGLRAGERRFALEHMLAQEPVGTLEGLSGVFAEAADAHAARRVFTGRTSAFLEERARTSAALTRELARDGAAALAEVERAGSPA